MKSAPNETARNSVSRLQMRVSSERRDVLERAASLTGRTLTEFVLDSAEQAARRAIEERHVLHLTQEDSEFLVQSLLNPPEPSANLRRAAVHYNEVMR